MRIEHGFGEHTEKEAKLIEESNKNVEVLREEAITSLSKCLSSEMFKEYKKVFEQYRLEVFAYINMFPINQHPAEYGMASIAMHSELKILGKLLDETNKSSNEVMLKGEKRDKGF